MNNKHSKGVSILIGFTILFAIYYLMVSFWIWDIAFIIHLNDWSRPDRIFFSIPIIIMGLAGLAGLDSNK
jgi:hypothetical protein